MIQLFTATKRTWVIIYVLQRGKGSWKLPNSR